MKKKKPVKKTLTKKDKAKLSRLYYNQAQPAGLSSVVKLAKSSSLPLVRVREWLTTQRVYTLFKSRKKKFQHRKIIVYGINKLHEIDLLDVSRWSKYNDKVKFLLTVVDAFSRKGYVKPLKRKLASHVVVALEDLYVNDIGGVPPVDKIFSDLGKEFRNELVYNLFKKLKIRLYNTGSVHKASHVERYNRTLAGKIYKMIYKKNDHRYIDHLPGIVRSLNNSVCRTTGFKPNAVTDVNSEQVWNNVYNGKHRPVFNSKVFKIGNYVRILRARNIFTKGFRPPFSEELFKIDSVIQTKPRTYVLRDLQNDVLDRKYYAQELSEYKDFDEKKGEFIVEKVLQKRTVDGKVEHLVRYFDLPEQFDEWLPDNQLRDL